MTRKNLGMSVVLWCLLPAGCHSPYVNATLENQTGGLVSPVEVDYPSASFGKESLPAGSVYHYRFKVLGSGPAKVLWTDSSHHEHTVPGPTLREGEEGTLRIVLTPTGANWTSAFRP